MRALLMAAVGLVMIAIVALTLNYHEAKFIACVISAKLTDRPPVRTDGLCVIEYLIRDN